MELIENKEMNKDVVEFSFDKTCSPLERKKLSESIKEIIKIKTYDGEIYSKEQILNYIIESVNSTTNSINSYFQKRKKESIDILLSNYHNSPEYKKSLDEGPSKYQEISTKDKKRTAYLIKENSEIKKDNFSVMFETLYIAISDLLNPKKKIRVKSKNNNSPIKKISQSSKNSPENLSKILNDNCSGTKPKNQRDNSSSKHRTVPSNRKPIQSERTNLKPYSKSFNVQISITEPSKKNNNIKSKFNTINNHNFKSNSNRTSLTGSYKPKVGYKKDMKMYRMTTINSKSKDALFENLLIRKSNKMNSSRTESKVCRVNLTEGDYIDDMNDNSYKVKEFKIN